MKGLSKMTTRSRKLGQDRLARLGTQDLTLRFDHQHLEMDDRARERFLPRRRPIPNRELQESRKLRERERSNPHEE